MSEQERGAKQVWRCLECDWEQRPHPDYGWQEHDERAIEVHRTVFCRRDGLEGS